MQKDSVNIILLGAPGSGKGTQGQYLQDTLKIPRISTGDLLREEVKKGSEIGRKVSETLGSGKFVSDDIIISLLRETLQGSEFNKGFILDGFPRNLAQATLLDELLLKINHKMDLVLELQVSEEGLEKRISHRYFCTKCGYSYNSLTNKPKVEGVCDICGNTSFKIRDDDKIEVLRHRLEEYAKQTLPLVQYYTEKGILHNVNCDRDIKEISSDIDLIIKKVLTC